MMRGLVQPQSRSLFAPESQLRCWDYLEASRAPLSRACSESWPRRYWARRKGASPAVDDHGRTGPDGPNFFAVFREHSQSRQCERTAAAGRLADRVSERRPTCWRGSSHEVRNPLNAIIGFSEVIDRRRFARSQRTLHRLHEGHPRLGRTRDRHHHDLLDLSRIERQARLTFVQPEPQRFLVEQCVAVMQPQPSRRIIIRDIAGAMLPPVIADARAFASDRA